LLNALVYLLFIEKRVIFAQNITAESETKYKPIGV